MAVRDSDGFGGGSDSGRFGRIRSSPAGDVFLRYLTFCMSKMTLKIWVPDSDGIDRESDSDGFGRIPGPQIWKSPTQSRFITSVDNDVTWMW